VRLLDVHFEYRFDEQGNWEERFRQRYRILNRQGVETWGGTSAGWSPWYMARPELRAQVQDAGGAVRELDPRAIGEAPAFPDLPDIYGDRRVLRAPLPGVHVGSVVTESSVRRTTRPFFEGGSSFQINFQSGIPRDSTELVIDLPEAMPFNYEVLDAAVKKEESLGGGRRHIVFRGQRFDGVAALEPFSPSDVPEWPSLSFSTGGSWRTIAAAYEKLMNEKLSGDAGVTELARRSVTPGASPVQQANQLLYALHQRVRYVAVEFGQSAIIPATPAEVLTRTYGDCKDQALTLVAMLRAVGLPATLALLRAGPGEDVRPRLPALDVFNHAIVVVRGKQPFWIDPTSDYARAGELPEGDQGRFALIIDAGTRNLEQTPVLSAAENSYVETREIRLREGAAAQVTEASSGTGIIEQRLRDSYAGSQEERTSSLTEYVKELYHADKLIAAKFDGLDDVREPLRITLKVDDANMAQTELFSASVPVDYSLLTSWLPEPVWADKPRRGDLRLPLRYQAEVRYRVVLPPHYRVKRLPVTPPLQLGPARLTRQYRTLPDGNVEGTFKFEIDQQRLSPAELSALKAGLTELGNEAKDFVELSHEAQQLFAARKPDQAMQLLQQLSHAEPKQGLPLVRLATKLGELGFGQAARLKALSALALDPKSALAQRTLGMLLQRDDYGRFQAPGFDRAGAAAAFRAASALDDSDLFSKLWLATLLEHDPRGRKYASERDIDAALEIYDAAPKDELQSFDGGFFQFSAANLRLGTHRFSELRENMTELPAVYGIAAETDRDGAPAGIAYADAKGLVGESRALALSTAASAFYTARRYPEASQLYEAAAQGGKDGAKYGTVARILKSAKAVDVAQLEADTPEAVVRKAELLVAVAEDPSQVPSTLLSDRAEKSLFSSWWQASAFDPITGTEPSRAVLADTKAAMSKLSVSGSDAVGYRVRVTESGFVGRPRVANRYVVKTSAGYAVRAEDDGQLGCEALFRSQAKDDRAAQQWLRWAYEANEGGPGDDPLRVAPFVRIWADGKGDAELAAAALCATTLTGKGARELLVARRGRAGSDESALEHAIALGARIDKDAQAQLIAAERLLKLHPTSFVARSLQLEALRTLTRYEDLEREARKAVAEQTSPRARCELRLRLAAALPQNSRMAEARRVYAQVAEEGDPSQRAVALNEAAWLGLFMTPRPPELLEQALQAVELSHGQGYAQLQTLASVLLDRGDVAQAQSVYQQLLDLDPTPETRAGTRFVQAGLAAAYGMPEIARVGYASIAAPQEPWVTSLRALAQERLRKLAR